MNQSNSIYLFVLFSSDSQTNTILDSKLYILSLKMPNQYWLISPTPYGFTMTKWVNVLVPAMLGLYLTTFMATQRGILNGCHGDDIPCDRVTSQRSISQTFYNRAVIEPSGDGLSILLVDLTALYFQGALPIKMTSRLVKWQITYSMTS